ncbi:hypothetical protein E0K83_14900 [Gramella sp. BOM4]|nr:hypothetical protein [Christiangramia bathymodioli]
MKHTNKKVLTTGLKYLAGALPLVMIGPSVLFSAFNNQDKSLFIPILLLGVVASGTAIFLMFKGILTIIKALFD